MNKMPSRAPNFFKLEDAQREPDTLLITKPIETIGESEIATCAGKTGGGGLQAINKEAYPLLAIQIV